MFNRIATDAAFSKYDVKVLSGPSKFVKDEKVPDGPWVLTLENFLTQTECDTLIELGDQQGYERSSDVGEENFDGTHSAKVSDGRTSSNAWCLDDCYNNATVTEIHERMSQVRDKISDVFIYGPGPNFPQSHL